MKKCAYCGIDLTKKNKTKEHIIPNGLIKLFPEQDITFTLDKAYKDNFGQSISDVCNTCNNIKLSELDSYGIKLIRENFMKDFERDDKLSITFNKNKLSRWLLKIAYNYERISKSSCTWFQSNMDYILGESDICDSFSIFAGLHVDMNPMGEKNDLYLPLSIGTDLKFYDRGIIPIESLLYGIKSKEKIQPLNFKDIYKSFSFRFASARFIVILWKKSSDMREIESYNRLIEHLFPYVNINKSEAVLERTNDTFMGRFSNFIMGHTGISFMDQMLDNLVPNFESVKKHFENFGEEMKTKYGNMVEELVISKYNDMKTNNKGE